MTRLMAWRARALGGAIGMSKRNLSSENMALPYLVCPDDLRALEIDPNIYLTSFGSNAAGWALDRKKDAALIRRLQSMHEPHGTMQ
jgi:hypothetical protein